MSLWVLFFSGEYFFKLKKSLIFFVAVDIFIWRFCLFLVNFKKSLQTNVCNLWTCGLIRVFTMFLAEGFRQTTPLFVKKNDLFKILPLLVFSQQVFRLNFWCRSMCCLHFVNQPLSHIERKTPETPSTTSFKWIEMVRSKHFFPCKEIETTWNHHLSMVVSGSRKVSFGGGGGGRSDLLLFHTTSWFHARGDKPPPFPVIDRSWR